MAKQIFVMIDRGPSCPGCREETGHHACASREMTRLGPFGTIEQAQLVATDILEEEMLRVVRDNKKRVSVTVAESLP